MHTFYFTGIPDDSTLDDPSRINDLRSRLDQSNKTTSVFSPSSISSVYDRLGKRDKTSNARLDDPSDARDEIERSKQRARQERNNTPLYRSDGYEKDGVYHDIYRAADADDDEDRDYIKADPDADERNRSSKTSWRSPRSDDDEVEISNRRGGRNNIKSRLGKVNITTSHTGGSGDLRDKIRNSKGNRVDGSDKSRLRRGEAEVKEEQEEDNDRLNLCIEIKREPDEMDIGFEF